MARSHTAPPTGRTAAVVALAVGLASGLAVCALALAAPAPSVAGAVGPTSRAASHGTGTGGRPGSTPGPLSLHLVVGAATDPATDGYWVVAANGGVFSFAAPFHGSAGALPLAQPVVGLAATPDGGGYWLVAADGGIFSFGDARFYGSTGGRVLNRPVVGLAATPDGGGYWLTAADGGVFSFGGARFSGSAGGIALHSPVVGVGAAPGGGYRLVAADGGVFAFGTRFDGSAAGTLARAAVALSVATGGGYRVVSSDGSIAGFGGAPVSGSVVVPAEVGETVAIDPGHDGGNGTAASFIAQPIDAGNFTEPCDTVGTETATGYTEHAFNFDVAARLAALLRSAGATVVMTRVDDTRIGPCVDRRAAIGNTAHADAAVSIHADGGPVSGRGFDVIEPAPVVSPISDNTSIVAASARLATDIRTGFEADTGEPPSDYSGSSGIDRRDNLGGLDLSTVPKVLIEAANMQNRIDAGLTADPQWRQEAAVGLDDGITGFLRAQEIP